MQVSDVFHCLPIDNWTKVCVLLLSEVEREREKVICLSRGHLSRIATDACQ